MAAQSDEDPRRAALLQHVAGWAPPAVVTAMAVVDRALFVGDAMRRHAWADEALPIGGGQTISQPSLVARMIALVRPGPRSRVLDVGTGSGYHAALLAALAGEVWSIERDPELAHRATATLLAAGASDVRVIVGDGSLGFAEVAPFDIVNVAAAIAERVPSALVEQLADGGRLIAPLGRDRQRLIVLHRSGDRLTRTDHGPVSFVPLIER